MGLERTKHWEKAKLAKKLYNDKKLKTDVTERLTELNELRKDVSYGQPGFNLQSVDLEELVSDLERFLEEVDQLLTVAEEG